jgi:transposase
MTYSTDLREKAMEYLEKGHSMSQAADAFGVSVYTINNWKQKLKETGSLEDEPRRPTFRKLDPESLRAHVGEHPDAYLKEMGEAFDCSGTAVFKALRRLKITRKKKPRGSKSRRRNWWRGI